ncbi:MAG: protein kinase [Candidatus Melainabacteria bacterium]|nr:protein kinase [Candidatus Melainabacteria bacterium]
MPNILIIEDKIDLANLVRSYLEYEEHKVEALHSGGGALQKIQAGSFDLIILDWDLPEMSGIDILKGLRATGTLTPVLMLTGKNAMEDKETGFDEGADDYLTKPFDMKELAMRVKALLRRSRTSASQSAATVNSITLDTAKLRATKNGRAVALTPREFELLAFLLREKPPHGTADLIDGLWPGNQTMTKDVVRTTVKRLRKKLGPDTAELKDANFPDLFAGKSMGGAVGGTDGGADDEEDDALDPFLGIILDEKYELVELLGGGGTGVVYKANHCMLNNFVAVKMLFPHMVSRQLAVRRFHQEAKATASLSHPNILKVSDFGTGEQGQPYLVMEYLQGLSLAEMLEAEGDLAPYLAVEIIMQAAAGLMHAHSKQVVHRDIKPSNLMIIGKIPERFTVKIVDFGLAKPSRQDDRLSKITVTGEVFGSPSYMSPEQCRGENVDHRADIYSLGCVLFEALTGRPPFVGKDPIDTIFQHVAPDPPVFKIEGSNPRLVDQMEKIIMQSLAKNREQRYQSVSQLLQDLLQFREILKSEGGDIKFEV